jgi:hypothetical protein
LRTPASVPVDLRPVLDLEDEELATLDELLDGAATGSCRQTLGRVDLGVEDERALAEVALASMIPLDSSSIVSRAGSSIAPALNNVGSKRATTPSAPSSIR